MCRIEIGFIFRCHVTWIGWEWLGQANFACFSIPSVVLFWWKWSVSCVIKPVEFPLYFSVYVSSKNKTSVFCHAVQISNILEKWKLEFIYWLYEYLILIKVLNFFLLFLSFFVFYVLSCVYMVYLCPSNFIVIFYSDLINVFLQIPLGWWCPLGQVKVLSHFS